MERPQDDARGKEAVGRVREGLGPLRRYVRECPQPGAALDSIQEQPRERSRTGFAGSDGSGELPGAAMVQRSFLLCQHFARGSSV